jgi:pimeloyl-ACP methyl ester carboxylesterase
MTMQATTARPPLQESVIPFTAMDGFPLNLIHVRGEAAPSKGPVLLVHGAGVRANIFRAPDETTLVDYLVERGYDVWLENWRASIDLPRNEWTLDQVALNDHPAAVQEVVRQTGVDSIQAVIHCQGSTSFSMSAVAGLVPQVRTIVSNAVSLDPVLPRLARAKILALITTIGFAYPYLSPQWGISAPTLRAKLVANWVRLTHHECNNLVCRIASFTYGLGFPTLWEHSNLNPATHEWLKHEFADVPRTFFEQMNRCVAAGHLVPVSGDYRLPKDFALRKPETDARFAFFSGALNRCFLPDSQRRTFARLDGFAPGKHTLHVIPKYAHLDVFMGQDAARDVFPLMVAELERE